MKSHLKLSLIFMLHVINRLFDPRSPDLQKITADELKALPEKLKQLEILCRFLDNGSTG